MWEPAEYDFTVRQGGTWARQMTLAVDDVNVDLTTYSARMKIRSSPGSTVLLSLTSSSGIVLDEDNSPNITVTITDEQSAALDFVYAVYDLEIESAGGVVYPLLYGRITLQKEITV